MVTYDDMFLRDLSGTLVYDDTRLVEFSIVNGQLVHVRPCSNSKKYWPCEFTAYGLTYTAFNEFFKYRVVPDGAQDIREYLQALGLPKYDFEKIVKKMRGRNNVDKYWIENMH